MSEIAIEGGRTLIGDEIAEASLQIAGGAIAAVGSTSGNAAIRIDARGLLVLPGIVDLHGDAFERQMMPRPGVDFPIDVALIDSDRQAIANGLTTVFHAVTWSWEPGLRSADNARRMLDAIDLTKPRLSADTRIHLRHETFNLDAVDEIAQWIGDRRVDLFAFNDHMDSTLANLDKPHKRNRMVERTGLSDDSFDRLVERIAARGDEVPQANRRLAAIAREVSMPMLSHDDDTPAMRQGFRDLGVGIAEFPTTEETARDAALHGDFIVFGAPNVVRGGSHTGWTRAADMIAKGLCSVLASDYYYPAPLLAAFRLVHDGILPLEQAWKLISENPARAAGLGERGRLATGQRADVLLVDDRVALRPRIVAVIAGGRLVHVDDPERFVITRRLPHPAGVAA
ncbi:alpha-D-ribose 1-methylphosphonate 5-triphosphate diphosphatase [Rhodopseudomonas thermotolerans]|uniref:Alpha-D-ribose 1-methylphosphonate 5-triphosphate diphosphatase n=2 Tax=Rhodopseudomonas TaxID=1073 RepID=A0A336JMY9_9BRAD|nr:MULTISPECIES: alpha-D-ribose 1-methylphosphonate 5-triphosphate diphosphatase [Rhodopseudomonas]RED38393.1 alpha-D-ribose 1-methylphosphonate 5-triphosphate diphosphatase [Rhodopseudomonas pentothenatexigens]REG05978.1 alpha-D-ribose 1-methylphosphonate 5-triphosphate diphosphatase [Rhodopseudomonas thermotolerans]SSW89846.1 alpha-D-ribose 1-methylphosphonate 5-triphosphate diphosphatase [Rhodopseudomonas pentothenatexigens]